MDYTGKLLIAHPSIDKNNPFYQTVIYVYQDDHTGTAGLILNRQTKHSVQEVCADQKIVYLEQKTKIYSGGPVNGHALLLLHTNDWQSANTIEAGKGLRVTSDNTMLKKLAAGNQPTLWKLFGGFTGWALGQLDNEMAGRFPYKAENSWLVANVGAEYIYGVPDKDKWPEAFRLSSTQMFEAYF